ncbi:hypothetical protein R83H12_02889 [Fibrobacteria bacterium R8-3-H12]
MWKNGKGSGCINGGCKDKFGNILTWKNLAEIVTIHASVYYHTNIGNYTAHKSSVEANCADDIFKKENSREFSFLKISSAQFASTELLCAV